MKYVSFGTYLVGVKSNSTGPAFQWCKFLTRVVIREIGFASFMEDICANEDPKSIREMLSVGGLELTQLVFYKSLYYDNREISKIPRKFCWSEKSCLCCLHFVLSKHSDKVLMYMSLNLYLHIIKKYLFYIKTVSYFVNFLL